MRVNVSSCLCRSDLGGLVRSQIQMRRKQLAERRESLETVKEMHDQEVFAEGDEEAACAEERYTL